MKKVGRVPKILRLLVGLVGFLMASTPAMAEVAVSDARLRLPLPGKTTAVAYFQLTNTGLGDAVLVSALVDGATAVEVHEHSHEGGMMRMRRVERLSIAPQQTLRFESGGYHLMVFGFEDTDESPVLTLLFSDRGPLRVPLRRESL